jgi:hypothetical protein
VKIRTAKLAPKTIAAAALPLVGGIVLALIDKVAAGDSIDDTAWLTLIASSPLIGGGAYAAPAAQVVPDTRRSSWGKHAHKGESGQGLVQTLMIIALVLFIIALVVWLLAH